MDPIFDNPKEILEEIRKIDPELAELIEKDLNGFDPDGFAKVFAHLNDNHPLFDLEGDE